MTEYEKMLSGEIYNAVDPSLLKDLYACSELCWEYNQIRPTDFKARNEKLKRILGEADDDTRIAYSDAVWRDVFHDNTSCSDGAAFTNCHSGKNCHIAAYPAVSAYGHRLGPFLPRVALLRVRAVAGGIDADIRPDEDIVADCNWSLVEDDEIEVGKEPPADLDMLSVVTMEWRVYECVVIKQLED